MSSTTPPPDAGGPEYLDQSGGDRLVTSSETESSGGGRRTALIAGGAVAGLAIIGGGAWAAMSFFATGDQPSEALPAATIGYASIDLDPSGGQKIEAFRMIQKFPAIEKELQGLDADDDLLGKAFEDVEKECDLTYDEDIKPWLGYRFAVAAVDLGEDLPTPVGVLQVSDAAAAEEGLTQLRDCAGSSDVGGWVIEGDWAIIAETEDLAQQVSDATADGTLADDETYQDWMGEVGDAGVMSMYAAPEAGKFLAELVGTFEGGGMVPGLTGDLAMDPAMAEDSAPAVPEGMTQALEDFGGAAATLRFSDGALEFEAAGSAGTENQELFATDRGDDVVATLPEDTAAAVGFGFADGWASAALEQFAASTGGEMTVADLEEELEASTGLTVADLETLAGDSAALSLGSDVNADTFFNSTDGSDVPVGAKVQGDSAAIEDALVTLAERVASDTAIFGNDAEGDSVAIGPNPDYRAQILADGGLGDTEVFQNVVREADQASAILFVNFDAGDWLTGLAEGEQEAIENLEPLEGLGFSTWSNDDSSHVVFRLTTN